MRRCSGRSRSCGGGDSISHRREDAIYSLDAVLIALAFLQRDARLPVYWQTSI
jgi:hypothetical protein